MSAGAGAGAAAAAVAAAAARRHLYYPSAVIACATAAATYTAAADLLHYCLHHLQFCLLLIPDEYAAACCGCTLRCLLHQPCNQPNLPAPAAQLLLITEAAGLKCWRSGE
jgi:hypothetical protein